ncbi:hypothetical protein [Methylobacterium dankookense]|uniref:Uncharacterized protein n=1 Tax=Methylobacterium dankookense TaxID=560405 RepID=A0A564G690_9HYPH|nr:hypothetical protein [Methylobacterium dankookense]GJD54754.1 hypothetical protein IFDJLNFL_0633 [Methylobacterium dankookense]VUF16073.1 hypothetical protein MTDSW087_05824 [Methylobacterium dankookense]
MSTSNELLDDANQITIRRLIEKYLSPQGEPLNTIWEACVTAQRIGNRYGVPADAVTYRYEFTHPDLGFSFSARAVWRLGRLMQPLGVHTVIEDYEDTGGHGGDSAVLLVVNDWLRSLPV